MNLYPANKALIYITEHGSYSENLRAGCLCTVDITRYIGEKNSNYGSSTVSDITDNRFSLKDLGKLISFFDFLDRNKFLSYLLDLPAPPEEDEEKEVRYYTMYEGPYTMLMKFTFTCDTYKSEITVFDTAALMKYLKSN